MEKIREDYIHTKDDAESLKWLTEYMGLYKTERGYRVESFISPKFIRITVYKYGGIEQ